MHVYLQLVLAGDPMQLGPVLRCRMATELGLGLSFLERLINLPLYARNEAMFADHGSYDPLLVSSRLSPLGFTSETAAKIKYGEN